MPQISGFTKLSPQSWGKYVTVFSLVCLALFFSTKPVHSAPANSLPLFSQLAIPILGVTLNQDHDPVGVVTHIVIHFEKRPDHTGLQLRFRVDPGQFSPYAQQAVSQAIARASDAARLYTDSWTIYFTFPYQGQTMYGDSLSAMVGLSVVAMAKGDSLIYGRTLTGTITEDGHIGRVGGIPYKVEAAYAEHMNRILIPEEYDVGDGDWRNPFMMQISPISTIDKAYYALTGHSFQ
ncbi:MAG: hypothetical protein VST68_00370 [Nitrospirota bacterium]|nr:hypothetical protein [Nitrospirota bacterium]